MKYRLNKGFITQRIKNKTTIFSGEESTLYTLNETAAYIFQGLKLGWTIDKIVEGLKSKFGASKKEAKKDLSAFAKELTRKKILLPTSSKKH